MIIKQQGENWFIGREGNATFFARTRGELYRKAWVWRQSQRTADKLIALEAQFNRSHPNYQEV